MRHDPINSEYEQETELYSLYESIDDKHLKIALLNVDEFVKTNNVQPITNPLMFIRDNYPSPDGLLSNEIFGITKEERSSIYGYIPLNGTFIHPLCYKAWVSMDSRIRNIVHGIKKYIINASGDFVEDENGDNGVDFLKKNFDKIKIRDTGSSRRGSKINFLKSNKDVMFMNKFIVIPPYFRDSNTTKNHQSVEGINKLYTSLIIASNALKETEDYGFSMAGAQSGRIQEIILNIYDFFCGNNNSNIDGEGQGLARKLGIIRRSVLSKTTDYGSRCVISAPQLKVERIEDMIADAEHASIPLATAITTFYPFVIFTIKRYFENWFNETNTVEFIDRNGNTKLVRIHDPYIQFNDEVIKDNIQRFIHGFSNRLIPITVEVEDLEGKVMKEKMFIKFKGYYKKFANDETIGGSDIETRKMTWCDILYMAACEATENKTVLITRFPIDSYFNQIPFKIHVSSTIDTHQVYYGDKYYKWYPVITDDMIGTDTSNMFVDTVSYSNIYLAAMGADYDGDQISVKGVYTKEANEELIKHIHSKSAFISLGGTNCRVGGTECMQALYNLTLALPGTELKIT